MSRAASIDQGSEASSILTTDLNRTLLTVDRDSHGDPNIHPYVKKEKKDSINMLTAWKLPNVALYAFAFGCIKAVFYILAFWLPSYLNKKNLGDSVAWIT